MKKHFFVYGALILALVGMCSKALSQQNVFSRSSVTTGNWWDAQNPWYYQTWNNDQDRPDRGASTPTRNFVRIGHNNNTTMTTNGAFFQLASLDLESSASSSRTINSGGSGTGISLTIGIYNASSATHTFNTDIGIDNTTVSLHNNSSGSMNFGGSIFINSNTVEFGGSGSGDFVVSGVLEGSNGKLSKTGSGSDLTLTAQNTYTGLTTVTAGTLILNRSGGSTIPSTNNVTVNGGTLRISSNQTLNNLTLSSGTLIVDNGVTLTINGTFSGGGTIENNGTIVLTGPAAFPGASTTITAMNNLQINRASGITLDKDLSITGTLTLSDGTITLGANHLTIGASGSIAGTFSAGEMIITDGSGSLRKNYSGTGSFGFPVGTSGAYTPVTLDFKSGTFSSAWASVRSIAFKHPSNTSSTDYLNRYWDLDQNGISSFTCDISCTYDNGDVQGTESNIYAGKYTSGTWTPASSTNTTTNTLTFNGATSFSDISGGELSALPVSLLYFTGTCNGDGIKLTWSTASEVNNSHFLLERSENGLDFLQVARLEGAGNSQELLEYEWIDPRPLTGEKPIYRLRQVDYDGTEAVYGPIRIEKNCFKSSDVSIFPQPANNQIQLRLNNTEDGELTLRILSMHGQIMYEEKLQGMEGLDSIQMDLNHLPDAQYLLQVIQARQVTNLRFLKKAGY